MIRSILNVAEREWQWLRLEPKYIVLVIVAPILFVIALGTMYSPKKVLHVPIAIVDQDHSRLSRELTRGILASETYSFGGYAGSAEEFPAWVANDRAHVFFVFPKGLERTLMSRQSARVQVLIDNSNYLAGSAEAGSASAILATFSVGAELHVIEAVNGVPKDSALPRAVPFDIGTRMWFNPAFNANYLNFMVAGLAYVAVQLAGLLVAIRAGESEYSGSRAPYLHEVTKSAWAALLGKLLPYFCIAFLVSVTVVHLPHWFFGAPLADNDLSFWLVLAWFVGMLVTLGFGLSCLIRDSLYATEICAILTLPNFLASGYTWPIFAMPKAMRILAYGLPMNSGAFMLRKITLMGGTLADCGNQLAGLTAWSILAFVLAWRGTRQILKAGAEGTVTDA